VDTSQKQKGDGAGYLSQKASLSNKNRLAHSRGDGATCQARQGEDMVCPMWSAVGNDRKWDYLFVLFFMIFPVRGNIMRFFTIILWGRAVMSLDPFRYKCVNPKKDFFISPCDEFSNKIDNVLKKIYSNK